MENDINKLSSRVLSLNGKVIIKNTLILSKTSYLSNVFPIGTKTTSKIHKKNISIYLEQQTRTYSKKNNILKEKTRRLKFYRTRSP